MSRGVPRFHPAEIESNDGGDRSMAERSDLLATARELEALAATDGIRPAEGFDDRVMRAIAAEPAPRVPVLSGSRALWLGVPLALRNAWAVARTSGRPRAVRAQALAFVLLVCVLAGSLVTAAGALTVGGLLGQHPDATPSIGPGPTAPAPTPAATPNQTPEPTQTPGTAASPSPEGPGATARPTATPKAGQTPRPTQTPRPIETPRPTETARPTETPRPTDTPQPTDHGSDGSGGGSPGSG